MDNISPASNVSSAPVSNQIPVMPAAVPVPTSLPKPPITPIVPPTPPMSSAPRTSMQAPEPKKHHSNLPALLILLVVALGYAWFQNFENRGAAPVATRATSTPAVVSDTPAPGVTVVQGGFPLSTALVAPVDDTVTSNYTATYANHSVTQYTLTLTSTQSTSTLATQYASYLSKNGYVAATTTAASVSSGIISGTKGSSTLCFTISPAGNLSSVQISLLVKGQ